MKSVEVEQIARCDWNFDQPFIRCGGLVQPCLRMSLVWLTTRVKLTK